MGEIPTPAGESVVAGIAHRRVSAWLTENISGAIAPFEFALIAGGRSNLTYRVTGVDGRVFVLRRPPLGHVLATAHDMGREHKIISAVGKTSVPVAPALGMCTDDSVNDAPFYVMGYVEGLVLDSPEAAAPLTTEARVRAAHDLIDVMVRLHAVEPNDIGLGDLGKRDGYLDRQLRRWVIQWDNSKSREVPEMDQVVALLTARKPSQVHTGIVHGDYRLGNCLIDPKSGELRAVLDWELCALGDQMADVGYLLVYYTDEAQGWSRANDPSGAGGFPTRQALLDRYAAATGRDLSGIGYYEAFSCWRLACISEGVMARYRAGVMGAEADADMVEAMEDGVRLLANRALAALEALP
jgi:aminoglycoside phosphotransferase (APT) family kinase protein